MEESSFEQAMAKYTVEVAKEATSQIFKCGYNFVVDKFAQLFKTGFADYINSLKKNILKTKTFFNTDKPISIKNFYVPSDILTPFGIDEIINSCKLQDICELSRLSLVTATGGAGKTMLMKYFVYNAIESKFAIPVFIELRNVNTFHKDFSLNIIEHLKKFKINHDDELLKKFIDDGTFVILLDGFDEIPLAKAQEFVDSIMSFSQKNEKTCIIISSRPDNSLSAFKNFYKHKVLPFDLDKSIEVVSKLSVNNSLKIKFIKDLKESLYIKHKSFLSNPLLLSIMLLTYGRTGSIPEKISTFYSQAYEALYSRHDTLKDHFLREKRSKLDIIDFEKVFSVFSLITYINGKHSFTNIEINEFLNKAKTITGFKFNNEHVIYDMTSSVCLIISEGGFFSFSHRSFQEYFAARQIQMMDVTKKINLIKRFSYRAFQDEILKILLEIDLEFVERDLICTYVKELKKSINFQKTFTFNKYLEFIKKTFLGMSIDSNKVVSVTLAYNDKSNFFTNMFSFVSNYCVPVKPPLKGNFKPYNRSNIIFRTNFENAIPKNMKDILKEVYNGHSWISKEHIEEIFRYADHLEAKYIDKSTDIDDIFGIKSN